MVLWDFMLNLGGALAGSVELLAIEDEAELARLAKGRSCACGSRRRPRWESHCHGTGTQVEARVGAVFDSGGPLSRRYSLVLQRYMHCSSGRRAYLAIVQYAVGHP